MIKPPCISKDTPKKDTLLHVLRVPPVLVDHGLADPLPLRDELIDAAPMGRPLELETGPFLLDHTDHDGARCDLGRAREHPPLVYDGRLIPTIRQASATLKPPSSIRTVALILLDAPS